MRHENHAKNRLESRWRAGLLGVGRANSNLHPYESTRINTARDCTDGYGRSRVILAKRKSISKERSAFNRIKHVLFLPVIHRDDKLRGEARRRRLPHPERDVWYYSGGSLRGQKILPFF